MLDEFKKFAMRGNVIDMAVGIVIGTAFGKIVTSFVDNIIMPPVGMLIGNIDFSDLALTLQQADKTHQAVKLEYGAFINTIISFLIISFSIFIVIRQMNRLKKAEEPKPDTTKECGLCLSEIPIKATKCKYCASDLATTT